MPLKLAIDRKDDQAPWVRDMTTGEWIARIPDISQANNLLTSVVNEIERLRTALSTVHMNVEGWPGAKASAVRIYIHEQLSN